VCLDGEPSSVGPTVSPGGVLDLVGEQPRGRRGPVAVVSCQHYITFRKVDHDHGGGGGFCCQGG
jgi:hypothetical protein